MGTKATMVETGVPVSSMEEAFDLLVANGYTADSLGRYIREESKERNFDFRTQMTVNGMKFTRISVSRDGTIWNFNPQLLRHRK